MSEQKFVLDNSQETSRAGYIRQEFMKGKNRKEIAEELGISYNIVFSATANMFNAAHPEGGVGNKSIIVENPVSGEEAPRSQVMKDLYTEGWTRKEIAVHFKVPYGTVYSATKDIEGPEGSKGGKVMITHPETGELVARVDYIREEFAKGKTRREIANAAGCDYSVVWMATKTEKDEEEVPEDEGDEA